MPPRSDSNTICEPSGENEGEVVDRFARGQSSLVARAQVVQVEIGVRSVGKRQQQPLTVGREARRKGHTGEIADWLPLTAFEIEQRHAWIALAKRHKGDLLLGRREARRHHQLVAVGEVSDVGPIHVHQRQALAPIGLGAALVDEHHPAVEETLLTGNARKDGVGDQMADTPHVFAVGGILLAGDLLAGRGIPQPELRRHVAAIPAPDSPGEHELRVDRLPGVDIRPGVGVGDVFRKRRRVDRAQEHGMREVIGDHRANRSFSRVARERRHGDRDRGEVGAGMDIDVARGKSRHGAEGECAGKKSAAGDGLDQGHRRGSLQWGEETGLSYGLRSGSKTTVSVFHCG